LVVGSSKYPSLQLHFPPVTKTLFLAESQEIQFSLWTSQERQEESQTGQVDSRESWIVFVGQIQSGALKRFPAQV
jgi:hypothetical protein